MWLTATQIYFFIFSYLHQWLFFLNSLIFASTDSNTNFTSPGLLLRHWVWVARATLTSGQASPVCRVFSSKASRSEKYIPVAIIVTSERNGGLIGFVAACSTLATCLFKSVICSACFACSILISVSTNSILVRSSVISNITSTLTSFISVFNSVLIFLISFCISFFICFCDFLISVRIWYRFAIDISSPGLHGSCSLFGDCNCVFGILATGVHSLLEEDKDRFFGSLAGFSSGHYAQCILATFIIPFRTFWICLFFQSLVILGKNIQITSTPLDHLCAAIIILGAPYPILKLKSFFISLPLERLRYIRCYMWATGSLYQPPTRVDSPNTTMSQNILISNLTVLEIQILCICRKCDIRGVVG